MALIVSDANNPNYDGYFSTPNGFYRAEAYNFGGTSTAWVTFNATRTIAATFANAGNCQGLIILLRTSFNTAVSGMRSVTVNLQENVASVWTTRATKTLTAAEICGGKTTGTGGGAMVRAFKFAAPYAVDTSANKWRFEIVRGASGTEWQTATSNGTNDIFVSWCDNQVSYTPDDSLVALDIIRIDQNVTLGALFSTGQTTSPTSVWMCSGDSPIPANNVKLAWDDSASGVPSEAWTLTCKGSINVAGLSTFEIGTEANPIPILVKAVLSFPTLTAGSYTGIKPYGYGINDDLGMQTAISWHGESNISESSLANAYSTGATDIVLTSNIGLTVGDNIVVGGLNGYNINSKATTWHKEHTVSAVSPDGLAITINALAGYSRVAGGPVVKTNSVCGIEYTNGTNGTNYGIVLQSCSNIQMEGVKFIATAHAFYRTNARNIATSDEQITAYIRDCMFIDMTTSISYSLGGGIINDKGFTIERCYFIGQTANSGSYYRQRTGTTFSGIFTFKDNLMLHSSSYYGMFSYSNDAVITGNRIWHMCNTSAIGRGTMIISGAGLTISNNYFYGCDCCFNFYGVVESTISSNTFVRCGYWTSGTISGGCYFFQQGYNKGISVNDTFTSTITRTHVMYQDCNADWCCVKPTGTFSCETYNLYRDFWVKGARIGVQDDNGLVNDCKNVSTYGSLVTAGYGLADTTVRTAGSDRYAIRMESATDSYEFEFPFMSSGRAVPTGNINGKTMMVGVWCKINSSDYYSGSYQMPRIYVRYDNATTVYSEAIQTTEWQLLFVSITPTTSYGQIEIWLSTKTDQIGSSAYVYFDDFSVLYPAGHTINLGGIDLYAGGLPIWPPISTLASAQDVWTVVPSSFGANTVGDLINKTKIISQNNQALILSK